MLSDEFRLHKKNLKEEVADQAEKAKATSDEKLSKANIPRPAKPRKILDFPEDITDIPSDSLGEYIGVYESHAAWISYCLSRRRIDLDIGESLLEFLYNDLFCKVRGGGATERKAAVLSDPFYFECSMELQEIRNEVKVLENSLESMERFSKAISREITSRKMSYDSFPAGRATSRRSDSDGNDGTYDSDEGNPLKDDQAQFELDGEIFHGQEK